MSSSFHVGPSLEAVREKMLAHVDNEAEVARLRWRTPGVGQAQEYQLTEEDALRYSQAEAPVAVDFPFVSAEARVNGLSMADTAAMILEKVAEYRQALIAIKELRRSAKVIISNSMNVGEIRRAANINWPQPS